jgi:hypothetical protein
MSPQRISAPRRVPSTMRTIGTDWVGATLHQIELAFDRSFIGTDVAAAHGFSLYRLARWPVL